MNSLLIIGLVFLAAGLGLRYWINRRRFYRRNVAGLEGFSSYEASVFIRFLESLGKWIALAMIIFGLLGIVVYWTGEKDTEKKEKQPSEVRLE